MQARCARILLFSHRFGVSLTPAAFTTQSPRFQRGLFLVRPTYTTTAPCLAGGEVSRIADGYEPAACRLLVFTHRKPTTVKGLDEFLERDRDRAVFKLATVSGR